MTKGSRVYKEEIDSLSGLRNGIDLKEYYARTGLGLEALFLRYVSGSLKPGGRAYVIVPQGLLTRTEGTTKEKLLGECNVLASISLPRNTFYNTPQKTYILAIEKRKTKTASRPPVFCAIVASGGETLDARRVPTPSENDMDQVAVAFLAHVKGAKSFGDIQTKVKIVSADDFTKDDRWDVYRFWSDDELVKLGEREEAVSRTSFMDEIQERFQQLSDDVKQVEEEIKILTKGEMAEISVADETFFKVRRGKRVTRQDGDENPGDIPVYSGSKNPYRPICMVNEEFAVYKGLNIESKPVITVNANGYVGAVFLRDEKCIIHDDVMVLDVIREDIDLEYTVHALRAAVAEGNYEYEAKLYNRVKELCFDIPVMPDGRFDLETQKKIAAAYKKFEVLKQSIGELGLWASNSRIKD